jgi:hypothetical protein
MDLYGGNYDQMGIWIKGTGEERNFIVFLIFLKRLHKLSRKFNFVY